MKPKFRRRLSANSAAFPTILVMSLAAASSAISATIAWTGLGGDSLLGTASNWTGGMLPSPAVPDTALWDGGAGGPLSLVYASTAFAGAAGNAGVNFELAATQTAALNIDSGANTASFRLNGISIAAGAGAFSLGDSANVFNITLGGAGGQTHTWTNNSANLATVNSDVTLGVGGGGTHTLALSGSGNWLINRAFAPAANNLNLLKTGAGTATLTAGGTLNGNNTNAHLPGSALMPLVVREGTLLLTGGTLGVTGEATIGGVVTNGGPGQNAKIQLNAGALNVSSWLSIGRGNGVGAVSSDLVLNNNSTASAGNLSAGFNADSPLNLPKGSVTLNDNSQFTMAGATSIFFLGESTGSDMTMTLNGASQLSVSGTGAKSIGHFGKGTLNINGTSSVSFGNQVTNVGYRTGSGFLNMTGGTLAVGNDLRVGGSDTSGTGNNGTGTVVISGGIANLSSFTVARGNNNQNTVSGQFTVTGTGIVNSTNDVTLGFAGADNLGKLTLSGGTLNVGTGGLRWLRVGVWDTSKGEIEMTNGNLNLLNGSSLKMNAEGTVGPNLVTQSGGQIAFYSDAGTTPGGVGNLDLQRSGAAASNNTYNFNGGILMVPAVVSSATTGTRTFNFNGGTLKPTGNNAAFFNLGDGTGTDRANVRAGGAIVDTNSFDVTIPQVLEHSNILDDPAIDGGLLKTGTGRLTLTADNTYTGPTTVTGGTLAIGGGGNVNSSSGITINGSGAKLLAAAGGLVMAPVTLTQGSLDGDGYLDSLTVANSSGNTITPGNGNAQPLSVDNLTFQGAATLNLRATGDFSDRYISAGVLATSASADVLVNVTNASGAWTSGTDYELINFSSYAVGDASHFTLGTVPGLNPNQSAELVNNGIGIVLRVTGESLVWSGAQSADWTTSAVGGSNNWTYLGSGIEFSTNSPVLFDDSATLFNVNLAENVSPSAIVFDNSTDYTISSTGGFGILTGNIIKNGFGKLTIATANSYTGPTMINSGVVELQGLGSIATSSTITNNGELIFNLSGSPNIYPNPIAGSGSITKTGAGTLTLAGVNTFSGNLALDSGTLALNSATALGTGPGVFTVTGGMLDNTSGAEIAMTPAKPQFWNADIAFAGSNSLSMGLGAVTLGGAGTFRTVNVAANTLGVGAVNSFGQGLQKTGAGKLNLLGGGNIAGPVDVQEGIVGVGQDLFATAPTGTGIIQNAGTAGTKWTFWNGDTDVTSGVLIRNNDGTNSMRLGIIKRGTGTLTLTNNANNATANVAVESGRLVLANTGTYGAGQDDGSTTTNLTAVVGNNAGVNGALEIHGATVNYNNRNNPGTEAWRSTLNVGNNATGAGALILTAGALSTNAQLGIGTVGGSYGVMRQTGGTTNVGGFLTLGLGTSQGILNLSGGTVNVTTAPATIGATAGGTGIVNLSGNAVYNHSAPANNAVWAGENGTGVINVSGNAQLNVPNNGVELGRLNVATSSGTLNLLGGTVTAASVTKPGAAATGRLNFNGGTLKATAPNAAFIAGLTAARVRAGGGTIDNAGHAITISQPLLAPEGNGISASGLTFSGGGYIGTPVVTITGDGTGATAVANIDAAGNLIGITVTNPGNNYTNASVAVVGGGIGNTGVVAGAPDIVPGTSGGMTFKGSAITSLSGVNTYTGNTTVEAGSSILLSDNAGLAFAPKANGVSNKVTGAGTAYFYGDFTIDRSGAAIANGNSWILVDTATRTFDPITFTVTGFTETSAGVHQLVDGANTWTFTEATGALTLNVSAVSGYASWITGFGLAASDQDGSDDPDGDSLNNLLEYVLGGNPSIRNSSIAPAAAKSGTDMVVNFNRSDLSEGDVVTTLEYGNSLAGWTSVVVPGASGTVGGVAFTVTPGSGVDAVTATIPTSGSGKFFARIKAVR